MAENQPVRLAYNSHEPANGADSNLTPIFFLHGPTGFKEVWADIAQTVANASKRKAYTIDARNHGDSEWSDYFNFDVNVVDLIHFMDTVGISKAIIVGQAMGGMTAFKTALKWPDRVEKIVVVDMFVEKTKEVIDLSLSYISLVRKATESAPSGLDEDGILKYILNHIVANNPPQLEERRKQTWKNPEDMTRFFKLRRDADGRYQWKANMEVIERAFQNRDTLSQEPQGSFDGPACFIYGKQSDLAVDADEHYIKRFFPSADFVRIEDAGNACHTSKPQEFTDELLKFIS